MNFKFGDCRISEFRAQEKQVAKKQTNPGARPRNRKKDKMKKPTLILIKSFGTGTLMPALLPLAILALGAAASARADG